MSIFAVIGGQWGDEGKGKVVDLLSAEVDIVARYQGGANAGHTVYINNQKIVLHQVPSGVLRKDCICLLGNGMVIDPVELAKEIKELQAKRIQVMRSFANEVRSGDYPSDEYIVRANKDVAEEFREWLETNT